MTRTRDVSSRGGITQVIPTSVTVGSGSGSVSANGGVTFTGVSSVILNGCFTSNYDNYRVVMSVSGTHTGQNNLNMNLTSAGSNISATYYAASRTFDTASATASFNTGATSSTSFPIGHVSDVVFALSQVSFDINSPFIAGRKGMSGSNGGLIGNIYYSMSIFGGITQGSVSADGMRFVPSVSPMTGTIRVYGYNNG